MSALPSMRASDVAAQQVEQIVSAAQQAAEQIRRDAERKGQTIVERARHQSEDELNRARKEAILLSEDAHRDAELIVGDARAQSDELREKTKLAVQGRVAAAEVASAEVLDEARALSGGLQQLARSLTEQAERILREVQAAHQRMQADLRIGPVEELRPRQAQAPRSRSGEPARTVTPSRGPGDGRETVPPRRRANPFDELEVPSWER